MIKFLKKLFNPKPYDFNRIVQPLVPTPYCKPAKQEEDPYWYTNLSTPTFEFKVEHPLFRNMKSIIRSEHIEQYEKE